MGDKTAYGFVLVVLAAGCADIPAAPAGATDDNSGVSPAEPDSGTPSEADGAGGGGLGGGGAGDATTKDGASGGSPDAGSDAGPPACPASALNVKTLGAKGDGTSDDTTAIQKAITTAGAAKAVLFPSGTYKLSATLNLPDGANLCGEGSPLLRIPASAGYLMQSPASNVTVSGLVLDGGGIELTSGQAQSGWQIIYNTFQNITNGNDGVHVDNILGKGAASSISHNTFVNIWGVAGGYPNLPAGKTYASCDTECIYGGGIFWHMGLDNTVIDDNTLDKIGYDAIKGFWDGFLGKTGSYEGHNVVISNNVMTHCHRMGIEVQSAGQGNCPGGCDYSLIPTDGTIVKNNFFSQPAFTWNVFAYSLMIGSTNSFIINNVGNNDVATCYVRAGIALENAPNGGVVQGNVLGSIPQSCSSGGWADFVSCGYTQAGRTNYYQNNVVCGPGAAAQGSVKNGQDPGNSATMIETGDMWTDSCPGGPSISTSSIRGVFTSPDQQRFTSGGSGTWKVAVASSLSLKSVQFFIDSGQTPVVTQEIQDVSTSFAADGKWLYHATIDTTPMSSGTHTITALATDVSKATLTLPQTFVR
jgi:hypothetical protein